MHYWELTLAQVKGTVRVWEAPQVPNPGLSKSAAMLTYKEVENVLKEMRAPESPIVSGYECGTFKKLLPLFPVYVIAINRVIALYGEQMFGAKWRPYIGLGYSDHSQWENYVAGGEGLVSVHELNPRHMLLLEVNDLVSWSIRNLNGCPPLPGKYYDAGTE